MLEAIRDFVRRLGAEEEPERRFDPDDWRLALAALLVRAMAVDGTVTDEERAKLKDVLATRFKLSDSDLEALVADAIAAEEEAVDLYRFTSSLKARMDEEARIGVVESLWEIVYADGENHEFEENLVWRVAELLGVNRRDRIARKSLVAKNKSAGA